MAVGVAPRRSVASMPPMTARSWPRHFSHPCARPRGRRCRQAPGARRFVWAARAVEAASDDDVGRLAAAIRKWWRREPSRSSDASGFGEWPDTPTRAAARRTCAFETPPSSPSRRRLAPPSPERKMPEWTPPSSASPWAPWLGPDQGGDAGRLVQGRHRIERARAGVISVRAAGAAPAGLALGVGCWCCAGRPPAATLLAGTVWRRRRRRRCIII